MRRSAVDLTPTASPAIGGGNMRHQCPADCAVCAALARWRKNEISFAAALSELNQAGLSVEAAATTLSRT